MRPVPIGIASHSVAAIFRNWAMPLAASVRLPVVPAPARRIVSVVMAMVTTPAAFWLMTVRTVPIGNGTEALAGMVKVRAVVCNFDIRGHTILE